MKNKNIIVVFVIVPFLLSFVGNDCMIGEKTNGVFSSDSDTIFSSQIEIINIQDPLKMEKDSLKSRINTLENQIKELQVIIETLKKDTIDLRNENKNNRVIIKNLESEKTQIEGEAQLYLESLNELRNKISKIDESIYKMCLLLPLELRCNSKAINESLTTIQYFLDFSENPSPKFKKYYDVYAPLLKDYSKFNEELIIFLREKLNKITPVGGVIGDGAKQKIRGELEHLPYYKYYLKRNDEPYQSIIYLDNAIDKFKSILDKKGNVQNDIMELIKSLEPK